MNTASMQGFYRLLFVSLLIGRPSSLYIEAGRAQWSINSNLTLMLSLASALKATESNSLFTSHF